MDMTIEYIPKCLNKILFLKSILLPNKKMIFDSTHNFWN